MRFQSVTSKNNLVFRTALPAVIAIILIIGTIFLVFIPSLEENLLARKHSMLQDINEMAFSILRLYEAGETAGFMPREEAQRLAAEQIRGLRYGQDRQGYFWIIDLTPRIVLEPLRPDLEGGDAGKFADAEGSHFFNEVVDLVQKNGEGFVSYLWQKEAAPSADRKLSYARLFEPWGWIAGSGVYLDDVQAEIRRFKTKTILVLLPLLFTVFAFLLYFIHTAISSDRLRKKADNTRHESEIRFRNLFEQSNDAIVLHKGGTIVNANKMACRMLGYRLEELLQKRMAQIEAGTIPGETAGKRTESETGVARVFETQWQRKDGTAVDIEVSTRLVDPEQNLVQAIGRDISRRKRSESEKEALEHKLRHAMKMETIGTLAGGIAHDFNNILAAIIGYADLAKDDLPETHPGRYNVEQVLSAGYRAKNLVKQILTFSRQNEDSSFHPFHLPPLIKETVHFLRTSLPPAITIKTDISAETGPVFVDPTQIHQVLMNLCTNGAQAMGQAGGTLFIRLAETQLDNRTVSGHPGARPGTYLSLQISDTGTGIAPDISGRIFDPYFTTQPRGEGSGMGLSVVHGIIQKHRGIINVQSAPEKGTTIEILLPILADMNTHEN